MLSQIILILKKILNEIFSPIKAIIIHFPGRMGFLLRSIYYRFFIFSKGRISIGCGVTFTGLNGIEFGSNNSIMDYAKFYANNGGIIKVGDNLSVNTNATIGAANNGKIIIGNNVLIAQNVVIRASDHIFKDVRIPINKQEHSNGEIIIEDDVWIGANAVITKDVRLGKHSVAGAVVVNNVEPFTVVGGVPAETIKKLE